MANKSFMDSLPAGDRKVIMDAARTASLKGRAFIRDNEVKQLAELQAAGMQIEEHPDIEAFRKATAPVVDAATGDTRKIIEDIRKLVK